MIIDKEEIWKETGHPLKTAAEEQVTAGAEAEEAKHIESQ